MYNATKEEDISNLKNTTANLRNVASETAEAAKQNVKSVAAKGSRKVLDFIHNAGDEITHAKDSVTSQIRTKPVQSSFIALGVGFVLGALLRGK